MSCQRFPDKSSSKPQISKALTYLYLRSIVLQQNEHFRVVPKEALYNLPIETIANSTLLGNLTGQIITEF
jgi:hypothetical protein